MGLAKLMENRPAIIKHDVATGGRWKLKLVKADASRDDRGVEKLQAGELGGNGRTVRKRSAVRQILKVEQNGSGTQRDRGSARKEAYPIRRWQKGDLAARR